MRFPIAVLALLATTITPAAEPAACTLLVAGAGLNEPFGVTFDKAGNVYIVQMGGNRVSVLKRDGTLSVLAGTGEKGFAGDGGPAAKAQFNGPHHLLMGPDGGLYVADTWNNSVRRIDLKTGVVTRVAGNGEKGFSGDGGPAIDARFGGIFAIAFRGDVLYACDLDNRRIRAIDLKTGLVRTVAGTGAAGFSGDGGPARQARLNGPKHISVDPQGRVVITDTENHVIRIYSPADGTIRRLAGTGEKGAAGLGGPPESCQLDRPHGAVSHPATKEIYISDSENHRVIRIGKR